MQSHHNLYTSTPTLNINISSPNTRYGPPPINRLSERSNNNKSSFLSYTTNNNIQRNPPPKVTKLYKRRSNALEMYVNDMNEIDNNRSKEFNISRSIDINDNSSSSIIYRRKEKEIIL
jgi:hypothetical protein